MVYSGRKKTYNAKSHIGPSRSAINKSQMDGWVDLVTPYNARFVEQLKLLVQPSHRRWDPVLKVWHVNELYLEDVIDLLGHFFDEVTTNLTVYDNNSSSDNVFKDVFRILPDDCKSKVYKSLAFALHPDKGGSQELMAKLNEAFSDQ